MSLINQVGICLALFAAPVLFLIAANPDLVSEVDRDGGKILYFACKR